MNKVVVKIIHKPIIMQHCVQEYLNNGGPATGYNLLMDSHLKDKYQFIPLIQKGAPGINFSLLKNLICQIKKVKPDIVHVRGLQSEGFYGLVAARLAGCKKVVVSAHGTSIDSASIGSIKKFIYMRLIEPFTLSNADLVYCVCDYAAKRPYIYKHTKNLYGHIHNAAPDYSSYDSGQAKRRIREELGIGLEETVVVSVGRVTVAKGNKDLVKAIKLLKGTSNIRYLIVGEGNYLHEMENTLSEEIRSRQVILLGKRSDVRDILFASNIFVFPTLHENLSNALLEACAAGLAIIATHVGGNPEVIKHRETGILIPPHDPDKLAKEIIYLTSNTKKQKEFAVNSQNNVRTNFSQQIIFDQLDNVYDSLLRK